MTDLLNLAERCERAPPLSSSLRESVARAFDARWPFFMPGPQTIDGHRTMRRFDWESAPAFHQNECFEKADIALAAIYGLPALRAHASERTGND